MDRRNQIKMLLLFKLRFRNEINLVELELVACISLNAEFEHAQVFPMLTVIAYI